MRGYPLLQLLLVGCLFAAAGLPVWRLTRSAPDDAPPAQGTVADVSPTPTPVQAGETALEVRVSFAPAPTDSRLSYLGRVVLEGRGPQADFTGKTSVTLSKEGADFALEAHWPAASPDAATTPAAARVIFRFPDDHTVERTVWSDTGGSMVELVTVTP